MPFELVASPAYFGQKNTAKTGSSQNVVNKPDFYKTMLSVENNKSNSFGVSATAPSSRAGSRAGSRANSPETRRRFSLRNVNGESLLPVHRN